MSKQGPQPPKPQAFAESLAQADGYEIAAAQAALAQSHSPQIRQFAERMITDHEHMAAALRDAAMASGLQQPPPHVGGDQARFLTSLQSLSGAEFDREYSRQQMLAHTSTMATMQGYVCAGTDANLRRLAASSLPAIEQHLQAARELMRSFP